MPVTIGRIEPIAVHLPLAQPLKRATGTTTTADNLLVRIEAGAVVGWGEAAAAPAMTPVKVGDGFRCVGGTG